MCAGEGPNCGRKCQVMKTRTLLGQAWVAGSACNCCGLEVYHCATNRGLPCKVSAPLSPPVGGFDVSPALPALTCHNALSYPHRLHRRSRQPRPGGDRCGACLEERAAIHNELDQRRQPGAKGDEGTSRVHDVHSVHEGARDRHVRREGSAREWA